VFFDFEPADLATLESLNLLSTFLMRDPGEKDGPGELLGDTFFSLSKQPGSSMVSMWVVGKESGERVAAADDASLVDALAGVLKRFAPEGTVLPRATRVVRSNWILNPLTRGSYSYLRAGATEEDITTLGAPLCKEGHAAPLLLFAGEATHPNYFGTVHGAFLAGEREADRILSLNPSPL